MNLEEKLRELRKAAAKSTRERELERELEYLRRLERIPKTVPAHRVPHGIEEYVEGRIETSAFGEYFVARQSLPFGRPYGKLRISDVSAADLSPLDLFFESAALPESSRLLYLDTETTGLAGGTGTCAFLIGVGSIEGSQFVVRQFFLRDYPDEKAVLAALRELCAAYDGLVTFNGKSFDVPLLETRYALKRLSSPFARLMHLDLLHPARQLWKLRLESCELTNLESHVLGISRKGDIEGWEIPQIYFDYLRSGNARGLQPVFYHNALDIITLAALTAEMARAVGDAGRETLESSLDLFSLSRIFDRVGALDESASTCRRALAAGLPGSVEPRALWLLASQHKRQRQYEQAAAIWMELARREQQFALEALEELAIYHEHRSRDLPSALRFVAAAFKLLSTGDRPWREQRFRHRLERLRRKTSRPARLNTV